MPKKRKGVAEEQAVREARPEIDLEATRTPSGRGYLGPMPSQLEPAERYQGLSPIVNRQNLVQQIAQTLGLSLWEVDRQYEGVPIEQIEDDLRRYQEERVRYRDIGR